MNPELTPIRRLPETFSGSVIDLWGVTPSAWPQVRLLKPAERKLVAVDLAHTRANSRYFLDQGKYIALCDTLRRNEVIEPNYSQWPKRFYWMYEPEQDRLVGNISVNRPWNRGEALAIGYGILPAYERRGYTTAAVTSLSDFILERNIAPAVCAEVKPSNEKSPGVLLKAGFQEVAGGLCSTVEDMRVPVRRFIKTKILPTDRWPIEEGLRYL